MDYEHYFDGEYLDEDSDVNQRWMSLSWLAAEVNMNRVLSGPSLTLPPDPQRHGTSNSPLTITPPRPQLSEMSNLMDDHPHRGDDSLAEIEVVPNNFYNYETRRICSETKLES